MYDVDLDGGAKPPRVSYGGNQHGKNQPHNLGQARKGVQRGYIQKVRNEKRQPLQGRRRSNQGMDKEASIIASFFIFLCQFRKVTRLEKINRFFTKS